MRGRDLWFRWWSKTPDMKLVPEEPLSGDGDYAYFLLQKPKPR
jgi:hypothetical protein